MFQLINFQTKIPCRQRSQWVLTHLDIVHSRFYSKRLNLQLKNNQAQISLRSFFIYNIINLLRNENHMDIPTTIGTIVSWPQYINLNSDDVYISNIFYFNGSFTRIACIQNVCKCHHPFFFCKSSNLMLFIFEFSQFVMDKSNSVIKFRDTKVQLMFEN